MKPPEIYTWEGYISRRRPSGLIRTASAPQRGEAAHLRKWNEVKHMSLLTKKQLNFINKVIHHPSMKHVPGFDLELKRLAARTKLYSFNTEAEITSSAAGTTCGVNVEEAGASIELSPDRLDSSAKMVVFPFGKPLIMVTLDGVLLDVVTVGSSSVAQVQLCLTGDGMVRVQNAANKDQYLVMGSDYEYCFGACEEALKFEVVVTDTGRVIYEEEPTGQTLQIEYQDDETLIMGRKTNTTETQSRLPLESFDVSPRPPASSAPQDGQASHRSTAREGSVSANATETSVVNSAAGGKQKKRKNKKKPKKSVDTQKKISQTTFMQTDEDTALEEFEVMVTPTDRVIYEEKSTGQALQINHEDQETLITDRSMNAAETQSRLPSEPSELSLHPPDSSAPQDGQISDRSTAREGSIGVNATETSDGKNKKFKNMNKNKKKSKDSVDTQHISQTTLTQTDTDTALQLAVIGLNRFEAVALASEAQIYRLKFALRTAWILFVLAWGHFGTALVALVLAQFLLKRFMIFLFCLESLGLGVVLTMECGSVLILVVLTWGYFWIALFALLFAEFLLVKFTKFVKRKWAWTWTFRVPNIVSILLYLESFVVGPGVVEVHDPSLYAHVGEL